MNDTWRDRAAPIIAEVIERVGKEDMTLLRRELRAAYPFGERRHYPYKIWCDEIRKQLGLTVRARQIGRQHRQVLEEASGQKHLF